jgi:hypothetical protein
LWNLLSLWKDKLVVLIIHDKNLTLPGLINLTRDDLTHTILILVVKAIMLKLENLTCKCLTKVKDGTTTELSEINTL